MKNQSETISIYVEDDEISQSRAGFSAVEAIAKVTHSKLKDVNLEEVRKGVRQIVEAVLNVLPSGKTKIPGYEIDEVHFTVGINGSGQVSLMSVVGVASATQVGIEFTIKKQQRKSRSRSKNG